MYTHAKVDGGHMLDTRFIAEIDSKKERWLVFDTKNHNSIVGVHQSPTLAALDAAKREQDSHQ